MLFKFPQILALHRQLLERIETLNSELENSSSEKPETTTIGRVLLDFVSVFFVYRIFLELAHETGFYCTGELFLRALTRELLST